MPEAATIVPAAPAARPAAAGAPSAVPASAGEIHVSPRTTIPAGQPEPKPESAKGKLFKSLEAKSNANPRTAVQAAAKPGERPGTATAPPAAKPGEQLAAPAVGEQPAPAAEPAKPGESTAVDATGKKPSPWKLVEEYKGKATKLEQELADIRKNQLADNDRKSFEERVTKAEARAKQLEESMAFVDYSQTEEFKTKYVEPYDKAWKVAMAELKDIKVGDGQGGERDVAPADLLTIINAPLAKARQMADEFFGPFANDVMAHRNEIRGLYDQQHAALEDAKKNGLARKQQETEAQTKAMKDLVSNITTTWQKENEAVLKDEKYGQFFKPREGDEHWNQRLTKGYELVDKAFSQNPQDPKLSAEERQAVIRRHAAVRNRAAAWGAMRGELESLQSQLKAVNEELAQYKGSEPPSGSERTAGAARAVGSGNAKADMLAGLRKLAH